MLLLALDTSTRYSSIALCSDDDIYAEHTWYSGSNHSVELLTHLQRILADGQLTLAQVDAIAVANGPGSFNGVRVALATAKTLAFTLAKPLLGVSGLDCIAMQQQLAPGLVCAVQEAGRSELYAACYHFSAPAPLSDPTGSSDTAMLLPRRLGEYQLCSPSQLVAYIQEHHREWLGLSETQSLPPTVFCGEISVASRQALLTHFTEPCHILSGPAALRRASALALLARQRLRAGLSDDPLALEPLYLRRPSITTSTRKQPLLGTGGRFSIGTHTTEREEGALRH